MIILITIMALSFFMIFFAMIGYPILLIVLDKILKPKPIEKNKDYEPTVSYMIVAHNEEDVIEKKLENALNINYPKDKLEIVIASDYSTDNTNKIVENFIENHRDYDMKLYKSIEHQGKTNAQNEAQKITNGEILVMTDANAILKENAIRELVSSFSSKEVVYVCGKLEYINDFENYTNLSESTYWNLDLKLRDIESRFQTITAGNGSIYAVRNKEYIIIPDISCHDSAMPYQYALKQKKALFNPDAISYEKTGSKNSDEFKRKIRMNRTILHIFNDSFKVLNLKKFRWFSLFFFGHRICRYMLWLMHIIFIICNMCLFIITKNIFLLIMLIMQFLIIILGVYSIKKSIKNKYLHMIGYYAMTVLAQCVAAYKQATGQAKPIWEKADSTR